MLLAKPTAVPTKPRVVTATATVTAIPARLMAIMRVMASMTVVMEAPKKFDRSCIAILPSASLPIKNPESSPLTLTELLGYPPRDGQIRAIHSLAVDLVNLLLIAYTARGKSAVFQAVPALRGGICLRIMPLNLLEEDQVSR